MSRDHYGATFDLEEFREGYVDVVDTVMRYGEAVAPRGAMTRELLAATIILPGDAPMLPTGTKRGVNTRLAAVEALQVIGGYSDADALVNINAGLAEFADQGVFHGAYGPRLRPQMDMVLRRLYADAFTRRAVVTLWDPLRDSIEGVKNYPCTTELQFMVRDDKLDLHVTMRANDAWHGLAYDAFVFNQLQHTVARMLGREVGRYIHHASSLHIYEEHFEATEALEYPTDGGAFHPAGVRSLGRARSIGEGHMMWTDDISEMWFVRKSHPELVDA